MLSTLLTVLDTEYDEVETIMQAWNNEDERQRDQKTGLAREGGRIDLSKLGPEAWMEFFRYTVHCISFHTR